MSLIGQYLGGDRPSAEGVGQIRPDHRDQGPDLYPQIGDASFFLVNSFYPMANTCPVLKLLIDLKKPEGGAGGAVQPRGGGGGQGQGGAGPALGDGG